MNVAYVSDPVSVAGRARPPRVLRLQDVTVTARPSRPDAVTLVHDVSFDIDEGEIVCLVGESGSGKSVTARTILGLTELRESMSVSGRIEFGGTNLLELASGARRALRGSELTMVFQEPLSSLDPVFTVESQMFEALGRAGRRSRKATRERATLLLKEVGIVDAARTLGSYPHQLSGGMCQRVMIAMALACEPRLLVADEPTTALDVTIQAQILDLIDRLRGETGMAVLLITHDMGVAAELADRVLVMYAGRVVEDAGLDVFRSPRHPYTSGLLACIPPMTGPLPAILPAVPGSVPHPSSLPGGCSFHPRCDHADARCGEELPPLAKVEGPGDGRVACWHPVVGHDGDR